MSIDTAVPSRVTGRPSARGEGVTLFAVLNIVLRRRRSVVLWSVCTALLMIGLTLSKKREYTSSPSFMPQSRRGSAGAAGIAAQLGISVPNLDNGLSPAFYADLVSSQEILGSVVNAKYSFERDGRPVSGTLMDAYDLKVPDTLSRRESAIRKLRGKVNAVVMQKTGVVNVAVRATSPTLAAQIAGHILDEINRFNLQTRRSQASAERQFTEARVAEAKTLLREAENRLQDFLASNRDYRGSPQLTFQQERLARDVGLRQQMYGTLVQSYEQARIEEIRDMPVITIIDQPRPPARPDSRGLVGRAIVGALAGVLIGVLLAVVREHLFQPNDAVRDEYQEFVALKRDAWDDLLHPWRVFGIGQRRSTA